MNKLVVGKIEDYDVYYVKEKDIVSCKGHVFPYRLLKEKLLDSTEAIIEIKDDFIIRKSPSFVQLACLTTSMNNIKTINKNIKLIKHGKSIS